MIKVHFCSRNMKGLKSDLGITVHTPACEENSKRQPAPIQLLLLLQLQLHSLSLLTKNIQTLRDCLASTHLH